jgi:hypothetical protein
MQTSTKVAVCIWMTGVIGFKYLLSSDNPKQEQSKAPSTPQIQDIPQDTQKTFTDRLTVHVDCHSKDIGYEVVSVDGKQVAFINGTHTWTYVLPGKHIYGTWGSCQAE